MRSMTCLKKLLPSFVEVGTLMHSPNFQAFVCSLVASNRSFRRHISSIGQHSPCMMPVAASNFVQQYKQAMSKVPQPVVVVTSARYLPELKEWKKRGVTCISFTSVSLDPPIVSFCLAKDSRMHILLQKTQQFAVHVLAQNQVSHGMHFSKPSIDGVCQFDSIPHTMEQNGIPVIEGCLAVFECKASTMHTMGDHHIWFGDVISVHAAESMGEPLLYFFRSWRTLGDEIFLKAFEDTTLPFKDWTHEAHLRMAWNYIKEHGKEQAIPYIRRGIQKYNEQNKDKIKSGYHETITMFFIHTIASAIQLCGEKAPSFEDFMRMNPHLTDSTLMHQYYHKDTLTNPEAKYKFFQPDKKPLP